MRQILFIHGGDTFDSHEEFMAALSTYSVDPYAKMRKWRMTLQDELQGTYAVLLPEMPNKQNASYDAWKLWFEKYLPHLHAGDVLVGHSLGAAFLIRYLSEERLPISVSGVYLIATPFFCEDSPAGGDFRFNTRSLQQVLGNTKNLVFYHSEDDQVVPFSDLRHFLEHFPQARTMIFKDRGHFVQESFPELLEDLRGAF